MAPDRHRFLFLLFPVFLFLLFVDPIGMPLISQAAAYMACELITSDLAKVLFLKF